MSACGICGGDPVGEACYHICPNSGHFYTPEQERQDEANWNRSEYYREAGFGDPEPDWHDEDEDEDEDEHDEQDADYIDHLTDAEYAAIRPDLDDLPF